MIRRSAYVGWVVLVATVVLYVAPHLSYAAFPEIYANGVLAYTNAERYKEGVPLLNSNAVLSQIAKERLQDLFARQYFAHVSPTGESVSDVAMRDGYAYLAIGENLALGDFGSSAGVVDAWMHSEGHRENILSPTYSEIGIAAGRGSYQGRNTWIVVQAFGLPRSSCPVADDALHVKITQEGQVLDLLRSVARYREKLLDDHSGSRAEYVAHVEAYNLAAKLYNDRIASYKALIASYNAEVKDFNECIIEHVSSHH